MRLLMTQARVHLTPHTGAPATVAWGAAAEDGSTGPAPHSGPAAAPHRTGAHRLSPTRKVLSVVDEWRYDGHWWEPTELRRHYYLLELDGGTQLELFQEGGAWWAARASD